MSGTGVAADWLLYLPLAKAVEAADGRLEVEGIASDESVDLEAEIVKASGLDATLRILEERGVIDWDHGRFIGQIDKARLIPRAEAEERFPELKEWFGRDFRGDRVFYLHGWVDAPVEGEPENKDLLDARHALKAGHRLGFSVSGGRVKRGEARGPDGHIYPATEQAVITKVALTSCPINVNTVARLAKSLSAAMQEPEGDEPVVVVAKGVMMAGTGTDSATMTGGRAMTQESLLGGAVDTLWQCPLCATGWTTKTAQENPPACRICGGEMVRVRERRGGPVRKGLSPLSSIAHNLDGPEGEDADMSGLLERLEKGVGHLADLIRMGKGAMDIPDEEEDPGEALADVAEEVDEAEDALGADEGEEEGDGPDEDAPIGAPEDEDMPPAADDLDDDLDEIIEGLGEMDDERDGDVEPDEDDEEDEDEMSKGMREMLAEDEVLGPVLDADEAFGRAFAVISKAVGGRFDAQEATIAELRDLAAAQTEALDVLVKSAVVQEEREQAREAAAQEYAATHGAMPRGLVIRKSPKDDEPEGDPETTHDRITKALHGDLISSDESLVMRKMVDKYGQAEEVNAALDRAETMPTGVE